MGLLESLKFCLKMLTPFFSIHCFTHPSWVRVEGMHAVFTTRMLSTPTQIAELQGMRYFSKLDEEQEVFK